MHQNRALYTLLAVLCGGCAAGSKRSDLTTYVEDWRDEVIYQILVDRFDNGDLENDCKEGIRTEAGDLSRYQGGDWRGIIRRLDYLKRLGISTIWISPIVKNIPRMTDQDGYHGYWAVDFTEVNPHFGRLEDLQELVHAAHQRNIKVIIDVVINHTGRVFFYDFDGNGRPCSNEIEPDFSTGGSYDAPLGWFAAPPRVFYYPSASADLNMEPLRVPLQKIHFHRRGQTSDYSSQQQKEMGDFPSGLRDLNTEHPEVLQAMVETYFRWVELTDVDGFRLDAVSHVPHTFWDQFSQQLRRRLLARGKHHFFLVGEVFDRDPIKISSYTRSGGLDAVFDFSLKWDVIDGIILDGNPPASGLGALEYFRGFFPETPPINGIDLSPWQARVAFMDNHDVGRVRGELDDPYAVELALTVIFTVDAIPSLYYGTEQELKGRCGHSSREILWNSGFAETSRTYRHIMRLAQIRRKYRALRRGKLVVRYASPISGRNTAAGAGLLVWERIAGPHRVLVAINSHATDDTEERVPTGFREQTLLRDVLGRAAAIPLVVGAGGTVMLRIPPRSAAILVPDEP